MKTEVFESYLKFLERPDKSVNGVIKGFAEIFPNWEQMNETNEGCWNCLDCKNCKYCWDCEDCVGCAFYADSRNTDGITGGVAYADKIAGLRRNPFAKPEQWEKIFNVSTRKEK